MTQECSSQQNFNYPVHVRKHLEIVDTADLRVHLHGCVITVFTDHYP